MKAQSDTPVLKNVLRRMILAVNGTLLCILLIVYCVLSIIISVTLALTDHIIVKLKRNE